MDILGIASIIGLVIAVFYITNLFNKGRSSVIVTEASDYFADSIRKAKLENLVEGQKRLEELEVSIDELVKFKADLAKL